MAVVGERIFVEVSLKCCGVEDYVRLIDVEGWSEHWSLLDALGLPSWWSKKRCSGGLS